MNHNRIFLIALALLAIGAFASVHADTWNLPKKEKYYSPNKKYYLEVMPKKLESQLKFFEDKVEGRDNAGSLKGVKENRAKGAFYARRADGGYSKKWGFPLLNEVSPVSALVSNRGDFVVTFDNWHSVGYGDDVVVIYRSDGTLVKKFGLEDLLTEGDIETLPRSVSSIWWGREHYIDETNGILVLKIISNGKSSWDESAKFHELKIELATGRPLEPKRDLFPQLRVFSSVDAGTALRLPMLRRVSLPVLLRKRALIRRERCAFRPNSFMRRLKSDRSHPILRLLKLPVPKARSSLKFLSQKPER